jgi:DhnA family fructose-bisphosphate aldolase class Ia
MSDVVIVDSGASEEAEAAEALEDVAEAIEDAADAQADVVMDATTIGLVDRMARMEEHQGTVDGILQSFNERLERLEFSAEMQTEMVQAVHEEVQEVATEAADAIQDTISEVEEASEEVTADEVPSATDHPFFRKWSKR